MGTRGTLKVYVNGELKVRQYNQWDSYPNGQCRRICEILSDEYVLRSLTNNLLRVGFATKEQTQNALNGIEQKDNDALTGKWLRVLIDRDLGANVLLLLASVPHACSLIPDWTNVFDGSNDDLEPEEGNYVLEIECETQLYLGIRQVSGNNVKFKLSGNWHDAEREFGWNYIPTLDELCKWEEEPDNRGE